MTTANNSTTPETAGGSKASLQPIKSEENHFGVLQLIVGTVKIIFGMLFGLVFLVIFLLVTITGIGPLIEY
eukprot:scaffold4100_cov112-Skeletonema_dohrnii-CCMP3373.AAC.2